MVTDSGAQSHGSYEDIVLEDGRAPSLVELAGIDPLVSEFIADDRRLEEKNARLDALNDLIVENVFLRKADKRGRLNGAGPAFAADLERAFFEDYDLIVIRVIDVFGELIRSLRINVDYPVPTIPVALGAKLHIRSSRAMCLL